MTDLKTWLGDNFYFHCELSGYVKFRAVPLISILTERQTTLHIGDWCFSYILSFNFLGDMIQEWLVHVFGKPGWWFNGY